MTIAPTLSFDPATGDLAVGDDGRFALEGGLDAFGVRIGIALDTFTGEWWLDRNFGLRRDLWLGGPPDVPRLRADLLRVLRRVRDVSQVRDIRFDFNRAARTLTTSFVVVVEDQAVEVTADTSVADGTRTLLRILPAGTLPGLAP